WSSMSPSSGLQMNYESRESDRHEAAGRAGASADGRSGSASDTRAGASPDPGARRRVRRGRLIALGILLICAAPIIASYFTYYVIRPEGRTNYGTLLEPLRTVGELRGTAPDGAPADLAAL